MIATWFPKEKVKYTLGIVDNVPTIDLFSAYNEQQGPSADDYIRDPDYFAEAYFEKPYSGSRPFYAQNPNISNRLEKNAVLTIRPVSVI